MPFQNYAVFTTSVSDVKINEGKLEAKGFIKAASGDIPIIIKCKDILAKFLKDGETKNISGELGYNEFLRHSGEKVQQLVLRAKRVDNLTEDGKTRNFVHLTVKAGEDGTTAYGSASGSAWGHVRSFKSMGKKLGSDEYRPSLWLTLKGFTTKEGDETIAYAIGSIQKGQYIEVKGSLGYELYNELPQFSVIVRKLDPDPDLSKAAATDAVEEEVAESEAA